MTPIPTASRYFSTRGVVSLFAISLSAAIVSAIGQHSLAKLKVAADVDEQRSIELQKQIASLERSSEQLGDAQTRQEELLRLTHPMTLSRALAELIQWLPSDTVIDRFSAASDQPGVARISGSLRVEQSLAQLQAKPAASYFSTMGLTQVDDASIQFSGTVGNVNGETGTLSR